MKKLFLAGALALFGAINAQQGTYKVGVNLGLPVGDASKAFKLDFGADVAYTFNVAPGLDLGLTTGYSHYLGKSSKTNILGIAEVEVKTESVGFIPVAATAQYSLPVVGLFAGADLGYAFSTQKEGKGGFYYQPKIGYTIADKNDVYIAYKGISRDGSTLGSLNLGYAFKF